LQAKAIDQQCRSSGARRYAPTVQMVTLTQGREIALYVWVHPDEDDRWWKMISYRLLIIFSAATVASGSDA
jgi:hypothetical protein